MKPTIAVAVAVAVTGCNSLPTETTTGAPLTAPEVPSEAGPTPIEGEPAAGPVEDEPAEGLHVIARAGTRFQLHPLVDGTLLVSVGPWVMRLDEQGELVPDPTMLRGIASIRPWIGPGDDAFTGIEAWGPVALGGRWPDAVYLSLDLVSGFRSEGGRPAVYRYSPSGWVPLDARAKHYSYYPVDLHAWIDGSILAQRAYQPRYPGEDRWQGDDDGPTASQSAAVERAIRAAKKLVVIRGTPKAPELDTPVLRFDSRPSGEIFVITSVAPPTLLRLDADGARHTLALPGARAVVQGVVADGPAQAWVYGATEAADAAREVPWLVRVDGEQATAMVGPACAIHGLASFVALEDGTQWATCGEPPEEPHVYDEHELWRRSAGGAWERQRLPPAVDTPRQVVVHGGDAWVAATGPGGDVLLRSRVAGTVLELPGLEAIGRQMLEWNDPIPVTKTCSYPYVPLRSSPADAAAVKAALDEPLRTLEHTALSITLVQTTIRGQVQLGLQLNMPDDHRDGEKVAKVARAALGPKAVDAPRCWSTKEWEEGGLAVWEGKALQ